MTKYKKPIVSIIAAVAENRAIGKENKLLWHIPEDLTRFKKITMGHPVIVGKNTFLSIGKPLPGRANIVVAKEKDYKAPGCITVHSFKKAVFLASQKDDQEIFIIGGGMIYAQGIEIADKLYITLVKGEFDADTFFPDYSEFNKVVSSEKGKSGDYEYTFLELARGD